MALTQFRDPADPLWEQRINGLESGSQIEAKAITAAKAVEATVPVASATESLTALAGTAGVARAMNFAYTAKAEANAKVKIIHNLGTECVLVQAWTTATKKPSEQIKFGENVKGGIEKVKVESANEVLLTLSGTAPTGKEEFIYTVVG